MPWRTDRDAAHSRLWSLASRCRRALTHRIAARARRDGELRRGASDDDLVALMNAAAWVRVHHSPRQADRLVDATLAGLRPV
jgi:hypothetical protein